MPEKEIVSAQVVFPDGRTLDEVIEELRAQINKLNEATTQEEST